MKATRRLRSVDHDYKHRTLLTLIQFAVHLTVCTVWICRKWRWSDVSRLQCDVDSGMAQRPYG